MTNGKMTPKNSHSYSSFMDILWKLKYININQYFRLYLLSIIYPLAVCGEDCHPGRGYCDIPGECKCRLGWAGKSCQQCQVLPGCQHGYCEKPLECRCYPGYTGILCQIRE